MGMVLSYGLLLTVHRLVWPSSMSSGVEGSSDLHLWKRGNWGPQIIKNSGDDLRRTKIIY